MKSLRHMTGRMLAYLSKNPKHENMPQHSKICQNSSMRAWSSYWRCAIGNHGCCVQHGYCIDLWINVIMCKSVTGCSKGLCYVKITTANLYISYLEFEHKLFKLVCNPSHLNFVNVK